MSALSKRRDLAEWFAALPKVLAPQGEERFRAQECGLAIFHATRPGGREQFARQERTGDSENPVLMKPAEVIRQWERYFNERDAEKLASLYHDEAWALQIAVGTPLVGRAAVLEDARAFFANIPDNRTHIINLVESGDWVSIEWEGGGTFQPTGIAFDFRGAGFFQIKEARILVQRGYWDMLGWCRSTGLPVPAEEPAL